MTKRILCCLLLLLLWVGAACAENAADMTVPDTAKAESSITSLGQLAQSGIRIAIGLNTPAEESAVMTVRYNGPAFDITKQENGLPRQVLQSAVSDMAYDRNENAQRPNQVTLHIQI